MAKKYPSIGIKKKPKNAGGLPCIICGVPTTGKVDIEVNWFRGDDEQVRVCAEHQSKNDAGILDAYMRTDVKLTSGAAAESETKK
jgi:hypothetical protein